MDIKAKDVKVGSKTVNFNGKANEKGYIGDKFGNKIFLTDSQEYKEYLKGKKAKAPKKAVQKATKEKTAKKTTKKIKK